VATEQIGLEAVLQDKEFQAGLKRYQDGLSEMQTKTTKTADGITLKWDQSAQRWRTATGQFATDAQVASAGVENANKKVSESTEAMHKAVSISLSGAGKAFEGIQAVGKVALGALAGAAVVAVGAIATIGPAVISAASDLNESMSKAQVVFGDSVKAIEAFAATSAESFGIAKGAAYEATSTFGNLFVTMGLGKGSAADMSVDIVKLAADLASFNNLDTADVLQKLRSGLIGEAEPMRSLGVMLTEDSVKAEALALGLGKTAVNSAAVAAAEKKLASTRQAVSDITAMYGVNSKQVQKGLVDIAKDEAALAAARAGGTTELTEAMKVQARYSLIMKQTKTAQGDFARTSDGLANTQRILSATFKDISTEIGATFLPLVLGVAQAISPIVKNLMPQFRAALEKIKPIITDIGNSIGIFVEVLMRTGDPIEAIRGALSNFPNLAPTFEGIVTGLQSFIATIQPIIEQVTAWIAQNVSLQDVLIAIGVAIAAVVIPALISVVAAVAPIVAAFVGLVAVVSLLRQAWENDWGGIRTTLTQVWNETLQPALEQLWQWLQVNVPLAIQTLTTFWTTVLVPAMQAVWTFISEQVFPLFETLWAWLQETIPAAIQVLTDFWTNTLLPAITIIWDFISQQLIPLFMVLAELLVVVVGKAIEGLVMLWNEKFLPAIKAIWGFIDKYLMPIFRDIAKVVVDVLGAAFEWARVHILNPFIDALTFILGYIDDIRQAIRGLTSALAGVKLPAAGGGTTSTPEYQEGGYVPRTGMAMIHGGEFVLSKAMLGELSTILKSQAVMAQNMVQSVGGGTNISNSHTVNVTVNPTYEQYQSPAAIRYDIAAALVAAGV
jgi:hypothetical protein